jgi:predicted Zn-dependent protease
MVILALGALILFVGGGSFLGRELGARHHLRQAQEALNHFDFDGAAAHLEQCLRIHPRDGEARLLAAQTARRSGRLDEAERRLGECEGLDLAEEALRQERWLLRVQRGDLAGHEKPLLERAERDPAAAPLVYEALARGNVAAQRLPGVLFCAERLLKDNPDHVPGLLCHGWAMEQMNRFEEAREDYRRAVALRPDDVTARLSLGEVFLHFKEWQSAREQFEYLRDRLPDNPAVLLGLARCLRGGGRTDEARALLDHLVRNFPREPLILSERGQFALESGRAAEAERWLRLALELAPHDRQANFALYQCLEDQGRSQEGQPFLRRFEEIEADLKRMSELRRELVQPGRQPARRTEAGLLCFRLGRDQEAISWLQSSLQEDPEQPEAHKALARYYERIGQPQRAAWHRQWAAGTGESATPPPRSRP